MIACHSGEIREVATNLLLNAIDASPQGGKIIVSAYFHDKNAVFEVRDDGGGPRPLHGAVRHHQRRTRDRSWVSHG